MSRLKTLSGNSNKIILLLLLLSTLLGVFIFHRDVVVDEGIYLYAGKLVAAGKIPYVDFVNSQGPLFSIIYGAFGALFGQDIYINRIITAVFGFAGLFFGGLVAKKLGGFDAFAVYFLFCIVSVYMLAHYVVVTTYGITAFFIYFSLFLAVNYPDKLLLSYFFILVASAIRLNVLITAPVFITYLVMKSEDKKKTLFKLLLFTVLFFLLVFFPFILKSPDLFVYSVFSGHIGSVGMIQRIAVMLNTLLGNLKDYSILSLCAFFCVYIFFREKQKIAYPSETAFVFALFAALFFSHLIPINNRGSHYNVLNLPLVFILIGCIYVSLPKKIKTVSIIFLLLNLTEQVALSARYRLIQSENPIKKINAAAEYIKKNRGPGKTILTFNTLSAIQSGSDVPVEFTDDCYSYKNFLTKEQCIFYHRVNGEIFMNYVSDEKIKLIALGDFDLHQFGPDKKNILEKMKKNGFLFVKKFEDFGQWHDNLYVFVKK